MIVPPFGEAAVGQLIIYVKYDIFAYNLDFSTGI